MRSCIHWVMDGRIVLPLPKDEGSSPSEHELLCGGAVKIVAGGEGTLVRWHMFSRNWASLYFAAEWLHGAFAPCQLQYYSAGWFNEHHDDVGTASRRIQQLIHKSDVHLSRTVYMRKVAASPRRMTPLLRRAWRDKAVGEDVSVDCAYDPASRRFRVARLGPQSTIARLWGLNPVSFPCLVGHAYDEAVSRAYPEVTRSGEPHHDHVYAAMASARGDVVWVPYQRVVLPLAQGYERGAVRVVTELAEVDISPL